LDQTFPESVLALMREIGKEINAGFEPQFSGNTIPVGSQWNFDAAIAQARFDWGFGSFSFRGQEFEYSGACHILGDGFVG